MDAACRDYGIFQLVGHGGEEEGRAAMLDMAWRFFDLPFGERARHMSGDIRAPVRYGTSFNQLNDGVLCWSPLLEGLPQARLRRPRRRRPLMAGRAPRPQAMAVVLHNREIRWSHSLQIP
nr:unnamed protein product [Digitaria exilis]